MRSAGVGSVFFLPLIGADVLIAILWSLMPFAIFGSQDLLRKLIREQRKASQLLQEQIAQGRARPPMEIGQ